MLRKLEKMYWLKRNLSRRLSRLHIFFSTTFSSQEQNNKICAHSTCVHSCIRLWVKTHFKRYCIQYFKIRSILHGIIYRFLFIFQDKIHTTWNHIQIISNSIIISRLKRALKDIFYQWYINQAKYLRFSWQSKCRANSCNFM